MRTPRSAACGSWRSALADGFAGLRGAADVPLALGRRPDLNRWFAYEARLDDFVRERGALIFCQYDRRHCTASAFREILRTHPVVVLDHLVCPNPYFEPPALTPDGDAQAELMDWRLAQLRRIQGRAEEAQALYRAPLAQGERQTGCLRGAVLPCGDAAGLEEGERCRPDRWTW